MSKDTNFLSSLYHQTKKNVHKEINDEFKSKNDMKKLRNNLEPQTEVLICFQCQNQLRCYTSDEKNYTCNDCKIIYNGLLLEMLREINRLWRLIRNEK